ncbi:MAG: response regulator, partial [Oscillospiraceae bacterium]|nr:response regulator [Oscillospiraceae bacterium]
MDNKITVVLADINAEFRTMMQETLEKTGEFIVVGSTGDGEEAWELVQTLKPKLLLTDLVLPRLDGFALVEQVLGSSSGTKIVIVSAQYRPSLVTQMIEQGVAYFFLKPCEANSLMERMRQAVQEEESVEDDAPLALERKVTSIIHEVGVPAHIKGYQYVREAIVIAVQDMDV